MVLWTVMPLEDVFPQEYSPNYEEMEYSGVRMYVERVSNDEYRVVRILSTNPQDYLRKELQPGQIISLNLIQN